MKSTKYRFKTSARRVACVKFKERGKQTWPGDDSGLGRTRNVGVWHQSLDGI
ncbi:hypothetical protein C8R44DRAFT_790709 [Mycena epipterygia]|nr:hypothetical protein C8R44DRAFT_790709 [Mycena epipterygia]